MVPAPIELRSDNAAGAAPELIAALAAANTGSALAYGGDAETARLQEVVREVFEHPEATAFPVASGTAANSLSLATLCPPWGSVLCHESAHILVNECGATSMFGGGAVMKGVGGAHARIDPVALQRVLDTTNWGDPHHSQPSVLSFTCPSDLGTVYRPDDIAALTTIARDRGLRTHLDGARFANAVVANECAPADLSWRAGIDMLSLGSIKNGGVSTDAIVSFDPTVNEALTYRLKRAGHVASKMRFQSAQLVAHLDAGLWLRLARTSNDTMAALAEGLRSMGLEFLAEPQANMVFVRVGADAVPRLAAEGLLFYDMPDSVVRFVTSFRTTEAEVAEALARVRRALGR